MPSVHFTQNVQRHVPCPPAEAVGGTVREVLEVVFAANPQARGYFLDEQGHVRHHVMIFIDGQPIRDRERLSDSVPADGEVYVMQALSGG